MKTVRYGVVLVLAVVMTALAVQNWSPVHLVLAGERASVQTPLAIVIVLSVLTGWLPGAVRTAAMRIAWQRRQAKADARVAALETELAHQLARSATPVTAAASYRPDDTAS